MVFSAPQLSLYELRDLAALCDGRSFTVPLLAVTSPQVKPDADRMGYTARIEAAGGTRVVGHVLLPVLCARDRRGQRLEAARHQQRQAGQHPRRLRLPADAGLDGSLRRCRGQRQSWCGHERKTDSRRATRWDRPCAAPRWSRNDGFSARYDLDRIAGIFSRPAHKLAGQSYVGKILVLDTAKGGVATAWMLHEMKSRGIVPLAIVFNSVNPILAQGAALGDVADARRLRRGHHRGGAARRRGRGRSAREVVAR